MRHNFHWRLVLAFTLVVKVQAYAQEIFAFDAIDTQRIESPCEAIGFRIDLWREVNGRVANWSVDVLGNSSGVRYIFRNGEGNIVALADPRYVLFVAGVSDGDAVFQPGGFVFQWAGQPQEVGPSPVRFAFDSRLALQSRVFIDVQSIADGMDLIEAESTENSRCYRLDNYELELDLKDDGGLRGLVFRQADQSIVMISDLDTLVEPHLFSVEVMARALEFDGYEIIREDLARNRPEILFPSPTQNFPASFSELTVLLDQFVTPAYWPSRRCLPESVLIPVQWREGRADALGITNNDSVSQGNERLLQLIESEDSYTRALVYRRVRSLISSGIENVEFYLDLASIGMRDADPYVQTDAIFMISDLYEHELINADTAVSILRANSEYVVSPRAVAALTYACVGIRPELLASDFPERDSAGDDRVAFEAWWLANYSSMREMALDSIGGQAE